MVAHVSKSGHRSSVTSMVGYMLVALTSATFWKLAGVQVVHLRYCSSLPVLTHSTQIALVRAKMFDHIIVVISTY